MKLFRGIRQSLIKEGNLKKYLLYAVGEILLVMIGISLAFQLDNWNDDRIKRNDEKNYYESLRAQIADDGEIILEQIHFNNRYMAEFKYVNEIIENNDRSKMDTLGLLVRHLTQYSDFDSQGNIYETMMNSGQINLLKNDKIVNGIKDLEENYIYINRMENIHYETIIGYAGPTVSSVLKFSNREVKKPDDVFSFEFQNLVISLIQIMEEKDRTYNQSRNEIDVVTKLIDEELDKK